MYLIIFLGLILRLTNIIKPEGLWNDEYVSWMVSSVPFGEGFFEGIIKQCHMPLYYFYLKPFCSFSDTVLRLTSVLPSVIAIYIMYLIGKEYSKKTGIFAGAITSVLSFLIYYSQEVRFYSLLFLFSAISLLFTLKLLKTSSKANIAGYLVSALLIMFTHVLGVIYVFFNLMYVVYKKRGFNRIVLSFAVLTFLPLVFFGVNILNQLPSSQWWGHFSYTNVLFLFSDFLSPILTNNVNAPPVFFYNPHLSLWLLIPTLIGCAGIIAGVRKNKGITFVALLTVLVLFILAYFGKIVFITKYATEVLPVVIILAACGFESLKKTGLILFSLFVSFHLAALFTPNYVTKIYRAEGHKIVGDILNNRKAENVIFTYYEPNRFNRYLDNKKESLYISKINRFDYRDNPEKILQNIRHGEIVTVVFLDSVSFFPEKYLELHKDKLPEMFVTFSHIRNVLTEELNNNYKNFKVDTKGSWTIITAEKK